MTALLDICGERFAPRPHPDLDAIPQAAADLAAIDAAISGGEAGLGDALVVGIGKLVDILFVPACPCGPCGPHASVVIASRWHDASLSIRDLMGLVGLIRDHIAAERGRWQAGLN